MRILIDADACPVTDIAIELAIKYKLEVVLVCDTSHVMEKQGASTIIVEKGADSADFRLVNMIERGDVVITQDYGLAALALSMGGQPISQNGMHYTTDNIDGLLHTRYLNKKLLRAGKRVKGPPKRTAEQDVLFRQAFERLLKPI